MQDCADGFQRNTIPGTRWKFGGAPFVGLIADLQIAWSRLGNKVIQKLLRVLHLFLH